MKHIKPFFGHCLQATQTPRIGYIMGFQEYFELEETLADLESGFDEKNQKIRFDKIKHYFFKSL